VRPEGLSMKNSSDTIGNRTRNLPACGTVPQPAASPRAPSMTLCTAVVLKTPAFLNSRCVMRHYVITFAGWSFLITCVVCVTEGSSTVLVRFQAGELSGTRQKPGVWQMRFRFVLHQSELESEYLTLWSHVISFIPYALLLPT
jgi:hypothetical protein